METKRLGESALFGWRDKVAAPLARMAPMRDETARTLLGFGFFLVSLVYVLKTIARAASDRRGS